MSKLEKRLEAARKIGQLLATKDGRDYFFENGYTSGQALVAADYDELIRDVFSRVHDHTPPVTIALVKGDELLMFTVEPSRGKKDRPGLASPESTIGMLYEALIQEEHGTTFRITDWDAGATAVSMPSAAALLRI